jgi:signal peptidase I
MAQGRVPRGGELRSEWSAPALALVLALAASGCGGSSHREREFRIPSPAMVPTLRVGDYIKVDIDAYRSRPPARGDVVVFHPPRGADPEVNRCGVPSQPADGHPCASPTPEQSTSTFVKRVVALPGDWIAVKRSRVYLATNSKTTPPPSAFQVQNEPFINKDANDADCQLCNLPKPVRIPRGFYYMAGDNRAESDDSRNWGPVPLGWFVGKVIGKE